MSKKHDPSVINIQQLGCNYCPDKYTDAEEYAKHATAEHKAEISEKWHKCPGVTHILSWQQSIVNGSPTIRQIFNTNTYNLFSNFDNFIS